MMRGLYIHVPFCVHKCYYCDFYSLPQRLDSLDAYVDAVVTESGKYGDLSFQTLYLGGGTPSLLGPKGLRKLIHGLKQVLDLSEIAEATLEANPESVTPELLESAKSLGINRISFGVQALSDSELQKVGRIHTAAQAMQAVELAQRCLQEGPSRANISADVILGLPGQDWPSLMVTLETLVGLNIPHLSLYCLSLEPHTPLALNPPADLPSDDEQAELYENASTLLSSRGFIHYEISNYALSGYECRHNLNYWRGGEYVGLGPAAASHLEGKRFKNKADVDAYIGNPAGQVEEVEELQPREKAAEEAMLRLRLLQEGLDTEELGHRYGDENVIGLVSRLNKLVKEGELIRNGSNYRLAPACALVSNPILARVLGD
jgi:putative oxygen-independent coproporphyrinogen III oxidase